MASSSTVSTVSKPSTVTTPKAPPAKPQKRPRRPNYNYIHRNLLPIEVHPLPVLIPHNPLSLVAIALSYLTQILAPPRRPTYKGYFSSATSSIHVTDAETIRKLWEMGFFGRGSLSRSEPTWLDNRKKQGVTAEENTAQRRQQRRQLKQERARKEQEEIEQKLAEESQGNDKSDQIHSENVLKTNARDLSDIGSVLDSANSTPTPENEEDKEGSSIHGFHEWKNAIEANGIPTPPPTSASSEASHTDARPIKRLQRTKTVRFSPTIEAREFDLSSPVISPIKNPGSAPLEDAQPQPHPQTEPIHENQEHLNLSLEEAFFLSYGLGVLDVYCDDSDAVLPPSSLLSLFRRHSYSPPRSLSVPAGPDDPFMLSYVVYHHYRSLGWVVRSGVKFSTDYLLYNRGPAFSHAEFAVVIVPSYSHPQWRDSPEFTKMIEHKTKKSWWWLHGVNRVQANVHKQLVLCYVDIPPPFVVGDGDSKGRDVDIGLLLSQYRIRDINVRRWTPNRSRD
ncbi:tRNA-intron endonuclease [Exophiala spinifera]|uniref:tRNA-intron lyase n=1 Tax=Exophiala spinifera TaxID=91928 RepID=A0A0D2B3T3_9EURO|nr:tRNA-intron endonuclease [Exophiala spinifera]KIW13543.1 tRNA-intron endonuclease [Exophiala spinifera]